MSPWIRTGDELHDDPRVVEISLAAYGLLHVSLGWAARHLTDGWVSAAVVRQRAGVQVKGLIDQLSRSGLWAPTDRDGQAGYQIATDIMAWQLTAEQAADRRRQRAEAGRTGGRRSAEARASSKPEANAQASAQASAQVNGKQA